MTTITDLFSDIDSWMPDERIIADVKRIIEFDAKGVIEFDEGVVKVPTETEYYVTCKALIKQNDDIGFGPCLRTVIAVGETKQNSIGLLEAAFAFVTCWHSASGQLITTDFSVNYPG